MIPAIIGLAAASAATSLYNGYQSSEAAKKASNQAAEQEQKGLDFQKGVWAKNQENSKSYIDAGNSATSKYQQLADNSTQPEFTYQKPEFKFDSYKDPGADYQMSQATRALNNSSLAKGLGGGGALKAIMSKNQEMAGTAYQGAFNRYKDNTQMDYKMASDSYDRNKNYQDTQVNRQKDLMNTGAQVASGLGTQGTQMANTIGQSYSNIGSSKASGTIGSSNALTQGINTGLNGVSSALGYYYGNKTGQTNNLFGDFNTGNGGNA